MMRALVIDDEPLARAGVLARLRQCPDIGVVAEHGDGSAALAAIRGTRPDLVFLDVDMPGMNGLDVLAAVPVAERPLAVLLTAHEQFAVQAFALDVVDYLLKPVEDDRFAEAVARARQAWRVRHHVPPVPGREATYLSRFTVRYGSRLVFVGVDEVDWIDAAGDYAMLHAAGREYLVRTPLHRLVDSLDPAMFARVHRSVIVRLDRVAELRTLGNRDAVLRLRGGTPLRASRTYIDALLAALERQRSVA